MANCNNLFSEYNKTIRLDDDLRANLREKRANLRQSIRTGYGIFLESVERSIPETIEFYSQGSFVMDTIINPGNKEDEYDLDDGVYFIGTRSKSERPEAKEFHRFVSESVKRGTGKSDKDISDKQTCVRVKYRGENGDFNYHIDLPSYYASNSHEPELAHLNNSWPISNPIEFIKWFEERTKSGFQPQYILERSLNEDLYNSWKDERNATDHQLRRIVRYLKAWGDNVNGEIEMPPGVVMTILAADDNYVANDRDDRSLRDTLVNIKYWLESNRMTCPRPTTPVGEDLFADYSENRKKFFMERLNEFITSANNAIDSQNQMTSCKEWQKHLGHRFHCHLAKDEEKKSSNIEVLKKTAAVSTPWHSND